MMRSYRSTETLETVSFISKIKPDAPEFKPRSYSPANNIAEIAARLRGSITCTRTNSIEPDAWKETRSSGTSSRCSSGSSGTTIARPTPCFENGYDRCHASVSPPPFGIIGENRGSKPTTPTERCTAPYMMNLPLTPVAHPLNGVGQHLALAPLGYPTTPVNPPGFPPSAAHHRRVSSAPPASRYMYNGMQTATTPVNDIKLPGSAFAAGNQMPTPYRYRYVTPPAMMSSNSPYAHMYHDAYGRIKTPSPVIRTMTDTMACNGSDYLLPKNRPISQAVVRNLMSSPMVDMVPLPVQAYQMEMFRPLIIDQACGFCKNRGEPENIYRGHQYKDRNGAITCPKHREATIAERELIRQANMFSMERRLSSGNLGQRDFSTFRGRLQGHGIPRFDQVPRVTMPTPMPGHLMNMKRIGRIM